MALLISTSIVTQIPINANAQINNESAFYRNNILFYDANGTDNICSNGSVFVGGTNTEIAFNYFVAKGLTPEQSAGLVGNFLIETAGTMDPKIKQGGGTITDPTDPSGKPGRGIAQWEFHEDGSGRWWNLLKFAEALGRDPLGLDTQLDFVMFELTGQPLISGVTGGNAAGAYEALIATTTVADAAFVISNLYEINAAALAWRDGELSYEEAFGERIAAAEEVFAAFAGGDVPSSTTCGGGGSIEIIEGDTTHIPCSGNILAETEADGYADGKLYKIRICQIKLLDGGGGPYVNSQISGVMSQMFDSAWSTGVEMNGGGFRTMQGQLDARIANCPSVSNYDDPDMYLSSTFCDPPTARPGYSNHQMGLAIDFNGVPKCPSSTTVAGQEFCQAPGNETWEWLTGNAQRYGLQQLRTEAWHWSVDGG